MCQVQALKPSGVSPGSKQGQAALPHLNPRAGAAEVVVVGAIPTLPLILLSILNNRSAGPNTKPSSSQTIWNETG